MKRQHEVDQPVGGAPLLSYILETSLLVHVLSYAWKDTFNLSLVCKRFEEIIRISRQYWKAVGLFALKDIIPKKIILEVDFFFGLRSEDPPYAWLWCVFKLAKTQGKDYLVFQYFKDRSEKTQRVLELIWEENRFKLSLLKQDYFPDKPFSVKEGIDVRTWYYNFNILTSFGTTISDGEEQCDERFRYVEMLIERRLFVWCGLVNEEGKPYEPFGVRVKASQYKRKPFYV